MCKGILVGNGFSWKLKLYYQSKRRVVQFRTILLAHFFTSIHAGNNCVKQFNTIYITHKKLYSYIVGTFKIVCIDLDSTMVVEVVNAMKILSIRFACTHTQVRTFGQLSSKSQFCRAYLFICFKRDIATNHGIKKDPYAPDCGLISVIVIALNPFRRCIDSSACKLEYDNIFNQIKTTNRYTNKL